MTIKKFLLTATAAATVFAFTVPVSFAACSTGAACPIESVQNQVTPATAACNKCKKDPCKCQKDKKFKVFKHKKSDPCCPTGAAAPACGCEKKVDPCDKCKQDKCSDPCYDANKSSTNLQTYAYPNAVYSTANNTVLGEVSDSDLNTATLKDDKMGLVAGVPLEDSCMTGAAAPILEEAVVPKSVCCPEPNVQSPNTMKAIYKEMEPCCNEKKSDCGCMTGGASGIYGQKYPDVPNSYWASSDINRLTEECVVKGYPDDMFKPNRNISRAEMATMVVKGYNLENTPMTTSGDFKDVSKHHWAYEEINKGVSSDMLAGYPDGKFHPNSPVTRGEAMSILSKGINCPMDACKADEILSKYSDGSSVPSWAKEHIAKAIDNGALKDSQSNRIRPQDKATRAEVSSMLQNVRIAGGYDTSQPEKTAIGPTLPTFVEKQTPVCIPTLSLEMKDIINAKNANVGERFSATTTHEITIDGVTYPCGSTVYGKITEVVRPSKCNDGGIKLSFNEIAGCDGCKKALPKQVLSARVEKQKDVNGVIRFIQMPFTLVGSTLGNVGRTVGGMIAGLGNASEALFDQAGVGTGELFSGNFKAAGRSYGDGIKTTFKAPVDFTRTALSGTMGLFQNTGDEITYLVDGSGNRITRINPKERVTIAFGNN